MRKSSFIIACCLLFLLTGALVVQHTDGLFSARQSVVRFVVAQSNQSQTRDFLSLQEDHFVIKYLPVDQVYLDLIAKGSEQAYQDVIQWFGINPSFKIKLVVYPNSTALARNFGWDRDQESMGVYWGGSIHILSPAVWMNAEEANDFYLNGPMVHELAHLMVDEISGGNYTRWFTEGVAQYLEKQINGFAFPQPFGQDEAPQLMSLKELEKNFDGEQQALAYWQALGMIEYIVDARGEEGISEILAELAQGTKTSQAVAKVLETSSYAFEQDCWTFMEQDFDEKI